MPFIPHTNGDINQMLEKIGVSDIEALFDEIPQSIREKSQLDLPDGLNECQMHRVFLQKCQENQQLIPFIGAGAYAHYTPSAVIDLISRGEFYSCYTPYQAEASQGLLEVIYIYQTMMASLTGMTLSNASMYDGATALAESILMAVRANRTIKSKKVLIADIIHPSYLSVVKTLTQSQGIIIEQVSFSNRQWKATFEDVSGHRDDYAAVVIPQINFYGQLTDYETITDWAKNKKAVVIGMANPTALGVLCPPGQWGEHGADIACGEAQTLGIPLSSGGPYLGFICATEQMARQMPGRIVGQTQDANGNTGYCLTLQAREQHIRRSKATSNICTNQGLMMTAATIYLSIVGPEGLKEVAIRSHQNLGQLFDAIDAAKIPGITVQTSNNFMYEGVLELPVTAAKVCQKGIESGLQMGYDLGQTDPSLANNLLVCTTEIINQSDIDQYVKTLKAICCPEGVN